MNLFKDCKYCELRFVGCHTYCRTYIRDKDIQEKAKEKSKASGEYLGYVNDLYDRRRR